MNKIDILRLGAGQRKVWPRPSTELGHWTGHWVLSTRREQVDAGDS